MILVTGAGGGVGSELTRLLRAAGQPFRAAYHSTEKAARAAEAGYDAVTVEMSDPDSLRAALDGVTKVFLLAKTGPRQVEHERNVIDAATTAGVRHVVKTSVWRADEELTPIAALHHPGERALVASGAYWTFLRPNFFMQTFSTAWAAAIAATGVFTSPHVGGPISLVDTRDIAAVAARTLTEDGHENRIYALTGPAALTYEDAAKVLSDVLGRDIRYRGLSDEDARTMLPRAGVPEFPTELLVGVAKAYRDGGVETVTSTVRELTGHEPASFGQFVADHRHVFA